MIRHDYESIYGRLCATHPDLKDMLKEWCDTYPEENEEKYYNFIWDKYLDGTLEAEEIWPGEPIKRLVSLCSGYESQGSAFRYSDIPFELSAWSEFDPESKTPHESQPAVVAHNLLFPRWADRNLGDMTKIDWEAWRNEHREDIDLLTYSTPCFVAGTLVMTDKGEIPIEQIKEGDMVLTHLGRYRRVVVPMVKRYYGNLQKIGINGRDILCTPEHPFYVLNHHSDKKEWEKAIEIGAGWDVAIAERDDDDNFPRFVPCQYNMTLMKQEDYVLVYNMEVEEDHSYTANGAIVHNCQSISSAGLQHGISRDSGTRSSILWYTEYAIKALQPKYLLQENVSALVSKKFMPDFLQWQELVASYGYRNYLPPQFVTPDGEKTKQYCMNSKNYGIAQNRERVFLLSVRNDLGRKSFSFPSPIRLEKKLKDILLSDVDEKYYLNQSKVDDFVEKNKEQIDKNASDSLR